MIYFIRAGIRGPIKAGFAIDPTRRLRQLQTANSEELHLLKVVPGDRRLEAKIHLDLKTFRKNGEWFEATNEVISYIGQLGIADYEIDDGKPYLTLWRETEQSSNDTCPFCGVKHSYGIHDGHRSPHEKRRGACGGRHETLPTTRLFY